MTAEKQKRNHHAARQNLTENTNMKIDKGIPIPKAARRSVRKHHDLYEIVEKMKVGDSFLVKESLIYRGVFSAKHALERKFGLKLAQRKTAEGVRVWRIA